MHIGMKLSNRSQKLLQLMHAAGGNLINYASKALKRRWRPGQRTFRTKLVVDAQKLICLGEWVVDDINAG